MTMIAVRNNFVACRRFWDIMNMMPSQIFLKTGPSKTIKKQSATVNEFSKIQRLL